MLFLGSQALAFGRMLWAAPVQQVSICISCCECTRAAVYRAEGKRHLVKYMHTGLQLQCLSVNFLAARAWLAAWLLCSEIYTMMRLHSFC